MQFMKRIMAVFAVLVFASANASAFDLVAGNVYTTNYSSLQIDEFTAAGTFVDSLTIPSTYGSEIKGTAFGPDGLLYAVASTNTGCSVLVINGAGTVTKTYISTVFISGNISYGKIAFATNGQFFVAGSDNLVAFSTSAVGGTPIYTNNQVYDVTPLPSGNLLVLSAYHIDEITTSGSVVRSIVPSVALGDARGIAYDAASDHIYVSMLGYSGEFFQIMIVDAASGNVLKQNTLNYADDLLITDDGRLIVGSRTLTPGVFDLNLSLLGFLGSSQQMFVSQKPERIFTDGFE